MKNLKQLFFPHDHKPEHFKALDGLRGVAVLFVLLSHASNENLHFLPQLNFHGIGKVGVYLFFVLSAYLLDRQIALAFMTKKSTAKYWLNYLLRRFLRIYPLFALALVLHWVATSNGFYTVIDSAEDVLMHLALLKGESIFWSIPVEFKYYFLSPVIMFICHKYLSWRPLYIFLFLCLLIICGIYFEFSYSFSEVSTLKFLPIFIVGTLVSIFELLYREKLKKSKFSVIYELFGILALLIICISIPYYFVLLFGTATLFHSFHYFLPYALLWAMVLLAAKYGKRIIKSLLELKILRFIGTISFSVYLFHMIFLNMIVGSNLPQGARIYVFFGLTFVFSSITYLLVERPLSKIRIYKKTIQAKDLNANS